MLVDYRSSAFLLFSFLFVYLCKNIIKGVISITPLIILPTDTVLSTTDFVRRVFCGFSILCLSLIMHSLLSVHMARGCEPG